MKRIDSSDPNVMPNSSYTWDFGTRFGNPQSGTPDYAPSSGVRSIDRRSFLRAAAISGSGWVLARRNGVAVESSPATFTSPWYSKAYRRNVLDMHITDWNDAFLSEFDPKTYVEMLRLAQVKSSVVVAQSHVGIANFPTQVGRAHRAMKDRPNLGQVIELCH